VKLLYCPKCHEVFSLDFVDKTCSCGGASGHYQEDGVHAVYRGGGIPLGIANDSFDFAIAKQAILNKQSDIPFCGAKFHAWVVPMNSNTFIKE